MTASAAEMNMPHHESAYGLSNEHVAQLTAELLEERPPEGDERFVCYMFDGADPNDERFANIGRQIECRVFNDAFDNDAAQMEEEYGDYEQQSIFFVSVDRETKTPTGVLRVIKNGPAGLKTMNDLAEVGPEFAMENVMQHHQITDLDECWDVGTVAVPPEFRSGSASVQLYRALYLAAMEKNIKHLVSVVDVNPLKKMTGYLGIPFEPMVGSRPMEYLGSEASQAVYGYVPDFYEKMSKKRRTLRGLLARKVLARLVEGSRDDGLQFESRYKKSL